MQNYFDTFKSRAHFPVLYREIIDALNISSSSIVVDATFGAGGYSYGILNQGAAHVYAFDRDPSTNVDENFFGNLQNKVTLIHTPFNEMQSELRARNVDKVDAIVFDLGVSSMQLDEGERGFSFMADGKLDMRMSKSGLSAADVVNNAEQNYLASILWQYGEEKKAKRIAQKIVEVREEKPIATTFELRDIISSCFSEKEKQKSKIHVATRSFQAIRIEVNEELNQLKQALVQSLNLLKVGGIIAVVSFHSLEDRIVKNFLHEHAGKKQDNSRYLPQVDMSDKIIFELVNRRVITAADDEILQNSRSRSAKLRVAKKLREVNVD